MNTRRNRTEKEEKRITRNLFLWMIITGLICAGLLVGVLVYFFVPRDGDTYILTIPSLVGEDESQIKSYPYIKLTREWIYSSATPKGRIISQSPFGGARKKLRSGDVCEVKIFVSLGEKTERIPDLEGVGVNSAAAALRALHVKVRSVAIYGDDEDGKVLYTSPAVGSEVKAGDTVTIFVARQRPYGSVMIPDFRGRTLAEAFRIALASGLYITENENASLDAIVQGQSIPADSKVKRGSYISFITDEATKEKEIEWPPSIGG